MKILKLITLIAIVTLFSCKSKKTSSLENKDVAQVTSPAKQKNILMIAVDDLKPLLSNYGHSEMKTPNFDRLASMGVTFTNANVQYAVCGPSRASVMTGTNPDRTRVWDLHTDFRQSSPGLYSMPEYLATQGYETTATGKIYHKNSSAPGHDGKSWTIPHTLPKNYDAKYGEPASNYYQDPETKRKTVALIKEANAKGLKGSKANRYAIKRLKPSTESADVPNDAYQDGLYTISALEKLNTLVATGKPFFLGVGYQRPHLPFAAPKKYWDLYNRADIDLAKFRGLSDGTPKIAYHSFGELRAYSDIDNKLGVGDELPEAKQRELIHGYMACISYIDAEIGKLLDALENKGILEDTVIVLWGDHGFHLGDHSLWCKHSNFEQATRIPFMFAAPGMAKGKSVSNPVELLDLFPTVFDLANVKASAQQEGKSLKPLLDNDASTTITQDYAMSQYGRGKDKNIMGYSLRTERYRYTEWHRNDYRSSKTYDIKNVKDFELYDYEKDPNETRNLVNDAAYASIVKELSAKMKKHLVAKSKF